MDNRNVHDMRSHTDIGEALAQRSRRTGMIRNTGPLPERRSTISSMPPCGYQSSNTRMRNLSGGSNGSTASGSSSGSSTQLDNQYSDNHLSSFSSELASFANNSTVLVSRGNNQSSSSHRKLDRSWSDTDNDRNGSSSHRSVNSSRYKTELCRPFEESGACKYGDKCQFAHGYHELRNLARHPKYKTELCRTFHTVGFCPYGPRCHFIHEEETKPADASPKLGRPGSVHSSSGSSSPSLSPSGSDDFNMFSYQTDNTTPQMSFENRQVNTLSVNINQYGSRDNSVDLHALEKRFSTAMNLNRHSLNDNVFSANLKNKEPQLIGTEERDIFSEVTMFKPEDVLDNAHKTTSSSCALQSAKLDNFPSALDRPLYWQSPYAEDLFSQMRPIDSYHSPTGSNGSSSGSDSGGSTDSLANMLLSEWRYPLAIGQY